MAVHFQLSVTRCLAILVLQVNFDVTKEDDMMLNYKIFQDVYTKLYQLRYRLLALLCDFVVPHMLQIGTLALSFL